MVEKLNIFKVDEKRNEKNLVRCCANVFIVTVINIEHIQLINQMFLLTLKSFSQKDQILYLFWVFLFFNFEILQSFS